MSIECLDYRAHESGALKGFANFYVPKMGIEIYGCGLFQKNGRRWLSLPSREGEQDGEKKYFQIMRFREKSHAEAFLKACMTALDEWIQQNAPPQQEYENEVDIPDEGLPF